MKKYKSKIKPLLKAIKEKKKYKCIAKACIHYNRKFKYNCSLNHYSLLRELNLCYDYLRFFIHDLPKANKK